MGVRNTESRIPEGFTADDLGQAHMSGNYAIVSYLTSPVAQETSINYVVFATNGAQAHKYRWKISNGSTNIEKETDEGIFEYRAVYLGELKTDVEILVGGEPVTTLSLTQNVVLEDANLKSLLGNYIVHSGPLLALGGDPQTSTEIVNDLRVYIMDAAQSTGEKGISPLFLAALAYKEAIWRPKEYTIAKPYLVGWFVRTKEIELAAEELNHDTLFNLIIHLDNSLGVCQMKPQTAYMLIDPTKWQELPEKDGDRKPVKKAIVDQYESLDENKKIDIFNLLRFPKTNIKLAAQLLTKLKNRSHRWPALTPEKFLKDETALKIIATEYNLGATETKRAKAKPIPYGGKVYTLTGSPFLIPFFEQDYEPELVQNPLEVARELARTIYSGWTYGGYDSAAQTIDCTTFITAVIEKLNGGNGEYPWTDGLALDVVRGINIYLGGDNLENAINSNDERIKGVAYALSNNGLGIEINPVDVKPGDFIQYWYQSGGKWHGHAAIIESIRRTTSDKNLTYIYGAHQSLGSIGTSTYEVNLNGQHRYIARWTVKDSGVLKNV